MKEVNNKTVLKYNIGIIALTAILGISVITIAGIFLGDLFSSMQKKSLLSLNIAPTISKITINDIEYQNGVYEMKPGKYTATISLDGFSKKNIDFEINNRQTTVVTDYILSEKEGFSYFDKSLSDVSILRNIKGDSAVDDYLKELDKRLSIVKILPLKSDFNNNAGVPNSRVQNHTLTISDGSSEAKCKKIICLKVSTPASSRKKALDDEINNVLKNRGYKASKYEIIYEYR